jgi:GT2 family glycosyltransferase
MLPNHSRKREHIVDISIVIATRDRGTEVLPTVRSVLGEFDCHYEVVVVDQSESSDTRDALRNAGLLGNSRLVYRQSSTTGVSRSRNEGINCSTGEILAFIDDDCIAPPNWASDIARRFLVSPEMAAMYATVRAAPELAYLGGWIPAYAPLQEGFIDPTPRMMVRSMGYTANMAARRSLFGSIGLFDEWLGPGSPLSYGEDTDVGYRALRAGFKLFTANEPVVTHFGVRTGKEISILGARYMRGMAVLCMKHVRCGDLELLRPILGELKKRALEGTMHLVHGRRPSGYRVAWAMLSGIAASLGYGIDRRTRVYRPRFGKGRLFTRARARATDPKC